MNSTTAGKGDPYWYEWTVGLLKVVEMLRPESGIQSVSFQVVGAKGWDDVVVRHVNGSGDFIQVKHSRVEGRNFTFGDLVGVDEQGVSLLGSLFVAWIEMKLNPKKEKCILFTNRAAGESARRSSAGVLRPPLFDFNKWLKGELKRAKTLSDCQPPKKWGDAWKEWLAQLKSGTPEQQLNFLNSFEIQANQEDLIALEGSVLTALSEIFQIPATRALPLFQSLDSELRRWTTTKETVSAEDVYSAMALDDEVELEHRAPPPPTPFFPSRNTALGKIETALTDPNGSPLVFLCAEPGAGKTSLISQLANRRISGAFQGIVGLRYFAFRPITPESPLIPPDADHYVRPDRLWFSLLSQLRQGLKGKLRNYQVPLRNNLLSWPEARTHVLRIAKILGSEIKRPFVIIIDGIDHAARAMRYEGAQAKDFFVSLPGPDEIGSAPLRIMLAGQPPESYPEYPAWLRTPHPKICTLGIGRLDTSDVRVLLNGIKSPIPAAQENAAVSVIESATGGNTLAVVFAVEETRTCNSVDELQKRLVERHLGDGLREYYSAIWQHALSLPINAPAGTEIVLASALCLTSERLTGQLMASAFKNLGWNNDQWQVLIGSIGPLVVQDAGGFRVLHNDVRVFLHGLLSSHSQASRQQGASMLGDHYMGASSNRWFAHKSLRRLLQDAGREVEWARVFTVDWVFEAAALGISYRDMSEDCAEALRQGAILKDWAVMLELTCATETLERWEEKCDYGQTGQKPKPANSVPPFLHTELFVRPFNEWHVADLHDLVRDAELLVAHGEDVRARALLERWLDELSVIDLCNSVGGLVHGTNQQGNEQSELNMGEHQTLESLGAVCRSVCFYLKSSNSKKRVEQAAEAAFEAGWVRASCEVGPFDNLKNCFASRPLRYLGSYESALRNLALDGYWSLVRSLMSDLRQSRDHLDSNFKAQAALWALQSDAALDNQDWLDVLSEPNFGFPERGENLVGALAISKALGWQSPASDPSTNAQKVFDALQCDAQRTEAYRHYKLLFRASATLGRVLSVINRRGAQSAAEILPPSELAQITTALWGYNFDGPTAHLNRNYAGELAMKFVTLSFQLGEAHRGALIEVAKPIADKAPVDFRRESVWSLFYRSGDMPRLQKWIRQWLADDGWLWKDDADSRESVAEDLLPLARDLGEGELASRAENRLRWLQITYRGHKEYTFDNPISWLEQLVKIEPTSWRNEGLRLWTLSEAASAQGADDRCSWELGETLGSAAWASGPIDVWQLLTSEYTGCGSDRWYNPTANRIIGGLSRRLRMQPPLSVHDRITGWCLAVGFSRWFNDENIKALARLRETLLETAKDQPERIVIQTSLENLTRGEFLRQPRPDSTETGTSSKTEKDEGLNVWLERIAKGEEVHPCVAASLLQSALSERPNDFTSLANEILGAVGVGAAYSWGWYSSGSYHEAVLKIGRLVTDGALWKLVSAAVKYAGGGSAWTQGICRNLYCVLLSRAAKQGAPELRTGLDCISKMHERWLRGGQYALELPAIKAPPAACIKTWTELAACSLTFLLASRSAEVIESAFVGIHAISNHDPDSIGTFLRLADGDPWKQHWLLNAAEVWATLHPVELKKSQSLLEAWLATGPLHLRLQAWIVLCQLAKINETPMTAFPHPVPGEDQSPNHLHLPARQIMVTPVMKHGSIRFVDFYNSAESTIGRVEHVTSANLNEVRSIVAEKLKHLVPEDPNSQPWPAKIRSYGDTRCSSLQGNLILDEAFDECFRKSPLPRALQVGFAQAFLGSENSWMLRATPIPDREPSSWPSEDELRGTSQHPTDYGIIRKKLLLLATQHNIAANEIVLAAKVQVFTYCEDIIFHLWWNECGEKSIGISANACPTTMSGRTFAFDFENWWEPNTNAGKRPLTFAVGGHQRLALCFPEFLPAKLWRSKFGWRPADDNPLVWKAGNQTVARYECIHAAPRFTRSGHSRQPILGRWIVTKSTWDDLNNVHGPFQIHDDFQRFSSDAER